MEPQRHGEHGAKPLEPIATPRTEARCVAMAEIINRHDDGTSFVNTDFARELEREMIEWRTKHWNAHHHAHQMFLDLIATQQQVTALRGALERFISKGTRDDGIDPEAYWIELSEEEYRSLQTLVHGDEQLSGSGGNMSAKTEDKQPPRELRCRHQILAGHCPNCPDPIDWTEVERNEQMQQQPRLQRSALAATPAPSPAELVPEFFREPRYVVVKIKDANKYLTEGERDLLERLGAKCSLGRIDEGKRDLRCVVVESDWPEYEPTWAAIEARCTSAPLASSA